jgi:hypothetical protein
MNSFERILWATTATLALSAQSCAAKPIDRIVESQTSLSKHYEHVVYEGRYDQLTKYVAKESLSADVYHWDWSRNNPDGKMIPVLSRIGMGKRYLGLCHAYPWFTDAEGIEVVCVAADPNGKALDPRIEKLEYRNNIDTKLGGM